MTAPFRYQPMANEPFNVFRARKRLREFLAPTTNKETE